MPPRVQTQPAQPAYHTRVRRDEIKISPEQSQAMDRQIQLSRAPASPLSPDWVPASLAPLSAVHAVDDCVGPEIAEADAPELVGPLEAAETPQPPREEEPSEVVGPCWPQGASGVARVPSAEELRARNVNPALKKCCEAWIARIMVGDSGYRNISLDARLIFREFLSFNLPTVTLSAIKAACAKQDVATLGFIFEVIRGGGMNRDDPNLGRAETIGQRLREMKQSPFGSSADRVISPAEALPHTRRLIASAHALELQRDGEWAVEVARLVQMGVPPAAAHQLVLASVMRSLEKTSDRVFDSVVSLIGPSREN